MSPWLIPCVIFVVCGLFFWCGKEGWSTPSKHFRLYKVLIDPKKAPDFFITVLNGDFPEHAEPGFITYVPPLVATKRGLKGHQIVWCLKYFKGGWDSENFSGNRAFKDRIHSIAAQEIPESIREKAKNLGAGEIRLIDDRIVAPQEHVGNAHCIGCYKVENGAVVAYAPNPEFQLFSDQGPLELVQSIRAVLFAEIGSSTPSRSKATRF